jgi:hypothetical protein
MTDDRSSWGIRGRDLATVSLSRMAEASPRGWLGRHDPPEPSVTRLDAMPVLPVAWFLRAEPGEEER